MSRLDDLANASIDGNPTHTVGTLMFATSMAVEFVLQAETWPVFAAWYKQSWPGADSGDEVGTEGREEMADMLGLMRAIALSGSLPQ